jgi:hypothetical protein
MLATPSSRPSGKTRQIELGQLPSINVESRRRHLLNKHGDRDGANRRRDLLRRELDFAADHSDHAEE